jgi:large subunit ribosomal protein L32e
MTEEKTKKAAKKPAAKKTPAKKPAEKTVKKPAEKTAKKKAKKEVVEAKSEAKEAEKPTAEPKAKAKVEAKLKPKELKVKKVYEIAKIKFIAKADSKPKSKTKPTFRRQEGLRYKRLGEVWRRPTGIDSKKLEKQRGKGLLPSIGYKKPASESGLHCGFEAVRVFNVKELSAINPGKQAAVIAAAVGRKKRNMIIDEANKLKITVLNPRRGEA